MKILAVSALAIAMFALAALPLSATETVDAEKVGSQYTLAMEGMT